MNIFKAISLPLAQLLKVDLKGLMDNKAALIQILAWCKKII